jgi:hypothetical protein
MPPQRRTSSVLASNAKVGGLMSYGMNLAEVHRQIDVSLIPPA